VRQQTRFQLRHLLDSISSLPMISLHSSLTVALATQRRRAKTE